MFDNKQKHHYGAGANKILLPTSYFDFNITGAPHKNALMMTNGTKMPFSRDYKLKQRDKYPATGYNHPVPPLATQQAIAMMEYELGNNLIISSNSNGHYKSKLANVVDKKR